MREPNEIAESVLMFDDADTPRSAIYQAVGAASVCWESMAGTGVFDDKRACEVAEALIQRLADFGFHIDGTLLGQRAHEAADVIKDTGA